MLGTRAACHRVYIYIYILLWCKELSNYVDVHDDILVKTIKIRLKSVKLFLSFKDILKGFSNERPICRSQRFYQLGAGCITPV